MDYFSSGEKIREISFGRKKTVFSKKRQFLQIILFILFFVLQGFLNYAGAQVVSEQDNVNINASVPGEDAGGGGGGVPIISDVVMPEISDIKIDSIAIDSARVSWKTNELAVPQLNYGRTVDLEKTYIGESFTLENSIFLENLLSQTVYYFEIIAIDRGGNRSFVKDLKFATLGLPDNIPPVNVSDFKAAGEDAKINLSWQNPEDADFQSVKLFRSESFFPKNPGEGAMVYDGQKTFFTDLPLENDKKYYYTIFTFDFSGNFSSGAVAAAVPKKTITPTISPTGILPSETPGATVTPAIITPQITSSITTVPIPTHILSKMNELDFDDFIFSQDGVIIIPAGEKIEVDFGKPVIISVDAGKIPEEVGAMMLILSRGDETFSFLFKLNPEKTKYETVIKPLPDSAFLLTITILDKKNGILKAITGQVVSVEKSKKSTELFSSASYLYLLFVLILAIILIVIYSSKKKKKKKKEKDNE